uniref:Uncharacterized protein n=1 Tax=Tetraselmis sp. GSL018 TaxID=582737 RepID=A0A061QJN3_9CHLO|mmetsp:Transcript_13087/g.31026  ORF Transcript_13087/g.31026 Transcript_13087/m.31026 type:complete len:214 (+) Transcript_13087:133-774(+)
MTPAQERPNWLEGAPQAELKQAVCASTREDMFQHRHYKRGMTGALRCFGIFGKLTAPPLLVSGRLNGHTRTGIVLIHNMGRHRIASEPVHSMHPQSIQIKNEDWNVNHRKTWANTLPGSILGREQSSDGSAFGVPQCAAEARALAKTNKTRVRPLPFAPVWRALRPWSIHKGYGSSQTDRGKGNGAHLRRTRTRRHREFQFQMVFELLNWVLQ